MFYIAVSVVPTQKVLVIIKPGSAGIDWLLTTHLNYYNRLLGHVLH